MGYNKSILRRGGMKNISPRCRECAEIPGPATLPCVSGGFVSFLWIKYDSVPETGAWAAPRPWEEDKPFPLFKFRFAVFDTAPAPTRRKDGQQVGKAPNSRYLAACTGLFPGR